MDGRLWGGCMAALLVAMTLAGCMQQPHFENAGAQEVSARANLPAAMRAAKVWDASAALVAVAAAESHMGTPDTAPDPHVGNGLAVVWTYVFLNNATESRYFDVSADGTVVMKNESQAVDDYGAFMGGYASGYAAYRGSAASEAQPLGAWPVDSQKAMAVAQENATFANVARTPNATVLMALGDTGAPGWVILATAQDMNVVALVNQTSAALVGVHDFSQYAWQGTPTVPSAQATPETPAAAPAPAPKPVDVRDSQTLTVEKPESVLPFHADAPLKGNLNLSATFQGDSEYLAWALKSGGKVVASGALYPNLVTGAVSGPRSDTWTLSLTKGGDYQLVLDLATVQGAVPLAAASYDLAMHLAPKQG